MKYPRCILILICLQIVTLSQVFSEELSWEVLKTEKVEKPPESVTLEYKFLPKETKTYDVIVSGEGTIQLPGQKESAVLRTNSQLSFKQQVVSDQPSDGFWKLKWDLVKGEMTNSDFGRSQVRFPALEAEIDKSGNVRKIAGLEKLDAAYGLPQGTRMSKVLDQLRALGFPKRSLKAGDYWEREYKVQLSDQESLLVSAVYTLEGFDRVDKTDCARIRTTYEVPFRFTAGGESTLTGIERGDIRTYFDYNSGKIVQCHGQIEITADLASGAKAVSDGSQETSKDKHQLDVKYHIVSRLVPVAGEDTTGGDNK